MTLHSRCRLLRTLFSPGMSSLQLRNSCGEYADEAADADLAAVGHGQEVVRAFAAESTDTLCEELRAEATSLEVRPLAEFLAAESVGEAEVIFYSRTGAGLTARSLSFDDQRAEPFGSSIYGGGQTCRPGSHHDHVVKFLFGRGAEADFRS